jgi:signal transduction histidine kinase
MRHYFFKAFNTVTHGFVFRHIAKAGTMPNVQKVRGLPAVRLTSPGSGVFPLKLSFKPIRFLNTLSVVRQMALNAQPMARITKIQYLAAVSLLSVFLINILTPPDFVIDILYVCSIVLVFRQNTKTIWRFSVAACTLIVINALFFDVVIGHHMSLWVNRLISLVAIGITSYIAIHYRGQTKASTRKQQQYITALEAMLFMMSHQVRRPVANILGLVEDVHTNHTALSEADILELCTHLQTSATELDTFINALSAFMEQTEKEQQGAAEYFPPGS